MEELDNDRKEAEVAVPTKPKLHPFPVPVVHRGIIDEQVLVEFLTKTLVPFNVEAVDKMVLEHRSANKPIKAIEICVIGLALVRDSLKEKVDDIQGKVRETPNTDSSAEELARSNQDSPADNG